MPKILLLKIPAGEQSVKKQGYDVWKCKLLQKISIHGNIANPNEKGHSSGDTLWILRINL